MTELNEQERMALNDFTAQRWSEFSEEAARFLDEEEIDALAEKLSRA